MQYTWSLLALILLKALLFFVNIHGQAQMIIENISEENGMRSINQNAYTNCLYWAFDVAILPK